MTVGDIKQYRYSVETTIECSGHGSSGFLHDLLLTVARVNGQVKVNKMGGTYGFQRCTAVKQSTLMSWIRRTDCGVL